MNNSYTILNASRLRVARRLSAASVSSAAVALPISGAWAGNGLAPLGAAPVPRPSNLAQCIVPPSAQLYAVTTC